MNSREWLRTNPHLALALLAGGLVGCGPNKLHVVSCPSGRVDTIAANSSVWRDRSTTLYSSDGNVAYKVPELCAITALPALPPKAAAEIPHPAPEPGR